MYGSGGMVRVLTTVLVLICLCPPARAGDGDKPGSALGAEKDENRFINERYPPAFRKRVNEAIQRGVEWLKRHQRKDGAWNCNYNRSYLMGPTALVTLTLLKGGAPPDSPAVRRAFAWLRKRPMRRTYSVGILLMALDAKYAPARDPFVQEDVDRYGTRKRKDPCADNIRGADLRWMREGVEYLVKHQTADGVWRYPSQDQFDLSNTQYALLGLKAAVRCGIKIRTRVWADALAFLLEHQEKSGKPVIYKANEVRGRYRFEWTERALARGFRYVKNQNLPVTGAMTTAGLAGLIICQSELWRSRRFTGDLRLKTRRGIKDAMAWMQEHFAVSRNPVQPGTGGNQGRGMGWHYYYLYGLERAGMLGRIRNFGEIDWYERGAEHLLAAQSGDGGWSTSRDRLVDSCFAILFLKRATSGMRMPVITEPPRPSKDAKKKPPQPAK